MGADMWAVGDAYEAYIGRWSRRLAPAFLNWLEPDPREGGRWLDVGCGTGALTAALLEHGNPAELVGVDPSGGFLAAARARVPVARFLVADARRLPFGDGHFDGVVSALVLNFVPDPGAAAAEVRRVTRTGATAATYLWDYTGGMQLIHRFWEAAREFDPAVADLDEGVRFPLCAPEPLGRLWTDAGFSGVRVEGIVTPTVFTSFDDYWTPFLGGQGPAPLYVASLPEERRTAIRERLRACLPTEPDGSIHLTARAWAVQGTA